MDIYAMCVFRRVGTSWPWLKLTVSGGRKLYRPSGSRGFVWRRHWSSWPNSTTIWRERSEEPQCCPPRPVTSRPTAKVHMHTHNIKRL